METNIHKVITDGFSNDFKEVDKRAVNTLLNRLYPTIEKVSASFYRDMNSVARYKNLVKEGFITMNYNEFVDANRRFSEGNILSTAYLIAAACLREYSSKYGKLAPYVAREIYSELNTYTIPSVNLKRFASSKVGSHGECISCCEKCLLEVCKGSDEKLETEERITMVLDSLSDEEFEAIRGILDGSYDVNEKTDHVLMKIKKRL